MGYNEGRNSSCHTWTENTNGHDKTDLKYRFPKTNHSGPPPPRTNPKTTLSTYQYADQLASSVYFPFIK